MPTNPKLRQVERPELIVMVRGVIDTYPGKQTGVADALGVTQPAISKAINAGDDPTMDALRMRILELADYTVEARSVFVVTAPPKGKKSRARA